MKRLLITISVFVILMCVNVYADETGTEDTIETSVDTGYTGKPPAEKGIIETSADTGYCCGQAFL